MTVDNLDQAIVKLKALSPTLQAFYDLKEVLDFISNNKGMVASHTSEIQRMTKEKSERQKELDILSKEVAETQKKLDSLASEYKEKKAVADAAYTEATEKARQKYMLERDRVVAEYETTLTNLKEQKAKLTLEVSSLGKSLEALRVEYDSLKARFK